MSGHLDAEILSAYLDRELLRRQEQRVEVHLEDCLRCRRRLDGLRRVVAQLRTVESAAVPVFLAEHTAHRVSLEERPRSLLDRLDRRVRGWPPPRALVPLLFGLVMMLVMIVYFFFWGVSHTHRATRAGEASPGASETVVVPLGGRLR